MEGVEEYDRKGCQTSKGNYCQQGTEHCTDRPHISDIFGPGDQIFLTYLFRGTKYFVTVQLLHSLDGLTAEGGQSVLFLLSV